MKFAAFMDFSFITFFHVLLVPCLSLHICLYGLYALVQFCKLGIFVVMFMYSYCHVYVFLLLCLCIIVMFMYSYCYVCSVLYILFSLCCSVYCLCVNV